MARSWRSGRRAAVFCLLLACGWAGLARADYVVQVGVFEKPRYAGEIARTLHLAGLAVRAQAIISVPDGLMIRLLVGPYPNRRAAEDALARVKALGQEGFVRKYVEGPDVKRRLPPGGAEAIPPPPAARRAPPAAPAPAPQPPITLEPPQIEPPPPPALDEDVIRQALAAPGPSGSVSAEDLFGLKEIAAPVTPQWMGFYQGTLAYTWPTPAHLSNFRHLFELSTEGRWGTRVKWKASGRLDYDAVFDLNDFYPQSVEDDQHFDASVRETYADISLGEWDLRLGRQHIIWGEMVALFFADVVSAKDLKQFILPDFDVMRIPQWAARAEYFRGDFHGEAIWIPYPTYDDIGVPGAEFYPYPAPPPPGYGIAFRNEEKPTGNANDAGYGLRLSYIQSGWDLSGFYYSSRDVSAAFSREIVNTPDPLFVYQPIHRRIQQYGATLSKDFLQMVVKAEAVYTQDRLFDVNLVSDADGLVQKDVLDYVLGLEYALPARSRLNVQVFQRWFPDHDPAMSAEALETGASLYLSSHYGAFEPQLLVAGSLNRGDYLIRPKLVWELGPRWRWVNGVDVFGGNRNGLFGRYDNQDRVYSEIRYTF